MIPSIRNISVRQKLIMIIMLTSSVSLLLASIIFITSDQLQTRKALGENLGTLTDMIAANTAAALLFGDNQAAAETLGFLGSQENIETSVIFDQNGDIFASYSKNGGGDISMPQGPQPDNLLFWRNHAELYRGIRYRNEDIGTIYIRSDLRMISDRLNLFLSIVAAVLLASLLVAYLLSSQLQRIITEPLLRLSTIARLVSTEKNYALRATGQTADELGNLVSDFNTMLDEIQLRDEQLKSHHIELEKRVNQRTRELEEANRALQASKEQALNVARRMEYQAHHDPLTGLPNRVLLSDRIRTELAHARRDQTMLAVMFLDLDRFKIINDSLGHATGDQLLRSISARLQDCLREGDTVARLGGDEFMILLPGISNAGAASNIGGKIIQTLARPIPCNGHDLHITTSIGISVYPYDGSDAEALIKHADISMYRAKEQGRNKIVFYNAEMNTGTRKKLAVETSLRKALEKGELELFYQPKVSIGTNSIIGIEALLRWQHPTMGYISPREFIPIAEDSGLIAPIGEWVLHTAFRQLREWRDAGHRHLTIATNLSSVQVARPDFTQVLQDALQQSGIDPGLVELEITENAAMRNIDSSISTLSQVKKMGIRIAIDDFGTGYSSLSYLRRLPVDTVKIDHSFVKDIPDSNEDVLIAQAIIAMAHSLNLTVVVEGVENVRQLNFFKQQNCDIIQGYLFSKPVSASELGEMLNNDRHLGTINLVQ